MKQPKRLTCEQKRCLSAPQIAMNPAQSVGIDAVQPLLRETMIIHIDGKPVVVYKDEIEKQLYGHLYSHLGLQYGG